MVETGGPPLVLYHLGVEYADEWRSVGLAFDSEKKEFLKAGKVPSSTAQEFDRARDLSGISGRMYYVPHDSRGCFNPRDGYYMYRMLGVDNPDVRPKAGGQNFMQWCISSKTIDFSHKESPEVAPPRIDERGRLRGAEYIDQRYGAQVSDLCRMLREGVPMDEVVAYIDKDIDARAPWVKLDVHVMHWADEADQVGLSFTTPDHSTLLLGPEVRRVVMDNGKGKFELNSPHFHDRGGRA
jgi:hypothetical protein